MNTHSAGCPCACCLLASIHEATPESDRAAQVAMAEMHEHFADEAECARCDHCGGTGGVAPVTYDAMVDGPGYLVTEELCANCRQEAA